MKRSSKKDKISKEDKKAKRNVKIKFTLHLKSLLNLSPALNDSDVIVAWKRGSKKSNKGESEGARVKNGAADWKKPQPVAIEATLIQYPTLHTFQQKTIEFTLKQLTEKKKTTNVITFEVDLAQYATDKTDESVTFPMVASKAGKSKSSGPLPPITPTITFNIKAEWLKIGNKKIVNRNNKSGDDDYDLQTDAEDDDQSETDIDDSDAESDSDDGGSDDDDFKSSKGGGGMDMSYSLDYPVATPMPMTIEPAQNGMAKEMEKELKQLQKEAKDLKKEISERDQVMLELIDLRARLDPEGAAKKKSSGGPSGARGWKDLKKDMADLKRWIEKRNDEAADLRKELEKANNNAASNSKGKKNGKSGGKGGDGDEGGGGGSGGGGGEAELEEAKKRLKDREEELKRVMQQVEQQDEELQKMHQIVDTVTRSGDKSGTIKLTSAQLKAMSGELKVKKELELERDKAKQKEKELDSSVRMLKSKEEEIKKLTKSSEHQEKKIKKLQEELEQLKQETATYKKLAESAATGGVRTLSGPDGSLGSAASTKSPTSLSAYGEGSDSGPWKVGGASGVIGTIRRKALSPRLRKSAEDDTDDDVSDRSEGSEKSKKKKKKEKGKGKESLSSDSPSVPVIPVIPLARTWDTAGSPPPTNSSNLADLKQQVEENEILEKSIYCADTTKYFTYSVEIPLASSIDLSYSIDLDAGKVTMQAGIPVAAKDLFMFLRETEALTSHALNQPFLQRVINALTICVERSSQNSGVQCYWMAFTLSIINQIATDKQLAMQPALDTKLLNKLKECEKKGILFDVNAAKPPQRREEVVNHFVRQMNVIALRAFLNLHVQLRSQILPILLPSILGQNNILKSHFASNSGDFNSALLAVKSTPKDITRLLSNAMDEFAKNYIFPSIVKQFLLCTYRSINVAIFNALMSRKELCTASNGYQIRFGLAQLTAWPFEITPTPSSTAGGMLAPPPSPREGIPTSQHLHSRSGSPRNPLPVSAIYFDVIDAGPVVQELEPTLEAAGVLVLDKTQLNSDDGLRHAAPFLHPVHLNHLLLSFTPDELSPNPVPDKPKKLLAMILSRESNNVPPLLLPDIPPVRFPGDGEGGRPPVKPTVPPIPSNGDGTNSKKSSSKSGGSDAGDYESDDKRRWKPARGGGDGGGRGGRETDEDEEDDREQGSRTTKKKGGYGYGYHNGDSDDDDGGLM